MSHKTRKYQEGLSGSKPSEIFREFDREGYKAKEPGYRDYLRNRDLAEQIHKASQNQYSGGGGSYESSPPEPLGAFGRIFLVLLGLGFCGGAFALVVGVINSEFGAGKQPRGDFLGTDSRVGYSDVVAIVLRIPSLPQCCQRLEQNNHFLLLTIAPPGCHRECKVVSTAPKCVCDISYLLRDTQLTVSFQLSLFDPSRPSLTPCPSVT